MIAETTDLPTKFVKIVVTDDMGRYLTPDLPKANYSVWVRGYGLVDSAKVKATPGRTLNLKATVAPDKKAAVEYYPALYWWSLLQVPPKSDFPGTGPAGNGISSNVKSQGEWIRQVVNTDGCTGCHQMGDKATREIPKSILSQSADSKAARSLRVKAGQAGGGMSARFDQVGRPRALSMYADWTDRIAHGELSVVDPSQRTPYDRGHAIGHALGGVLDLNIIPQSRTVNRGGVWRQMERYCHTHPGTYFFCRPIYTGLSSHPAEIEFGVLRSDGSFWVQTFKNYGTIEELERFERLYKERIVSMENAGKHDS